jgi:mycoredoxin
MASICSVNKNADVSWSAEMVGYAMTETISYEIKVYGTQWCGSVTRVRRLLDGHNIPYTFVNINQDADALHFVLETNHGNRSVPTILFPDGSILVEPSEAALAQKLGITI